MDLVDRIFSIKSTDDFEKVALIVYDYQVANNSIYGEFVSRLNWKRPTRTSEIPFLPISFFKSHSIQTGAFTPEITFMSSGTGGSRSRHLVKDLTVYERSFSQIYSNSIGPPEDQVILALLPNYLEQGASSLVYMVDQLIKQSENSLSGFVLGEVDQVINRYSQAKNTGNQVVIIGVSYALLDLCELKPDLSEAIILETGGMKGRRKELTKEELHSELSLGLNCQSIYSEYGMTELLSQAYSTSDGIFTPCPWMKLHLREVTDPFTAVSSGKTGGINIIDLANLHSCAFIATDDLGKFTDSGFQLMGRFDQSDIRGCNQLIQ
ncbi:MAG: hypothetical protein ACI865_001832 [Flavobacteriaceae bacterium]|jgi:hypothetical protein